MSNDLIKRGEVKVLSGLEQMLESVKGRETKLRTTACYKAFLDEVGEFRKDLCYEWILIRNAGLLPKLKFVSVISGDVEDGLKAVRVRYFFDPSLTKEELSILITIQNPFGMVITPPSSRMLALEHAWNQGTSFDDDELVQKAKTSFWVVSNDDLGRAKSIKSGNYKIYTAAEDQAFRQEECLFDSEAQQLM